jgi:hypothetical protein
VSEVEPEVDGFDSTAYAVADGVEVAWVTTPGGPVRLEQGDPLPEGVHPDEVARLANGGVLADLEIVNVEAEELPELANLDELKVRVGTDAEVAQRYLDAEQAREGGARKTWVAHLEGVVADVGEDGPVVSADAGPGAVSVVDEDA